MFVDKYKLSNHALNRMIERVVLSQNIKLTKRQKNHNKRIAIRKVKFDLENFFAQSFFKGYKAVYSNLRRNNTCTKYIISKDNIIVTILNNINIHDELSCYSLKMNKDVI